MAEIEARFRKSPTEFRFSSFSSPSTSGIRRKCEYIQERLLDRNPYSLLPLGFSTGCRHSKRSIFLTFQLSLSSFLLLVIFQSLLFLFRTVLFLKSFRLVYVKRMGIRIILKYLILCLLQTKKKISKLFLIFRILMFKRL